MSWCVWRQMWIEETWQIYKFPILIRLLYGFAISHGGVHGVDMSANCVEIWYKLGKYRGCEWVCLPDSEAVHFLLNIQAEELSVGDIGNGPSGLAHSNPAWAPLGLAIWEGQLGLTLRLRSPRPPGSYARVDQNLVFSENLTSLGGLVFLLGWNKREKCLKLFLKNFDPPLEPPSCVKSTILQEKKIRKFHSSSWIYFPFRMKRAM